MTKEIGRLGDIDDQCSPVSSDGGWAGLECPAEGGCAKILFHPDGSVIFENEGTVHCAQVWSAAWQGDTRIEVSPSPTYWVPTEGETLYIQPERQFCLNWRGSMVLDGLSREAAERIARFLREAIMRHHDAVHSRRVRDILLVPVFGLLLAVTVGGTAGFICAVVLSNM